MLYKVVREHTGDRDYKPGDTREASPADVRHLIPNVLVEAWTEEPPPVTDPPPLPPAPPATAEQAALDEKAAPPHANKAEPPHANKRAAPVKEG